MERIPTYILAGGRNAEGEASIVDVAPTWFGAAISNVLIWNPTANAAQELFLGLNQRSSSTAFAKIGPEAALGTMLRNLNGGLPVLLVKLAVKGSTLSPISPAFDWSEEANELRAGVESRLDTSSSVLAGSNRALDVRGVYWQHGQTDVLEYDRAQQYRARLLSLVDWLRGYIDANGYTTLREPVPFVSLVLHDFSSIDPLQTFHIGEVQAAQRDLASERSNVFALETDGVYELEANGIDFTADGHAAAAADGAALLAPWSELGYRYRPSLPAPALAPGASVDSDPLERRRDEYSGQALQLLPYGLAWTREPSSNLAKVLRVLAELYARVDQRARNLIDEAVPRTATELLSDWEALLGIPRVPLLQPGHYLNLRTITGTDDLRALCFPTFPVPAVEDVEFTLTAWIRPTWSSNGWLRADGTSSAGRHYLFRRLNSGSNRGLRVYLESTAAAIELGPGATGPALELHVEIGSGSSVTDYTIGIDNPAAYPMLDAFAAPVNGSTDIAGEWGFLAITYAGANGPAGVDRGRIRAFVGGQGTPLVQVGSDINVQPADRLDHASGTEGVLIGANGSFDPLIADVDQVRIYDRALAELELQGLHVGGDGRRLIGTEADLLFGWEFDVELPGSPRTTPDVVDPGSSSDLQLGDDAFVTTGAELGVVLAPRRCPIEVAPTLILRRFEAVARLAFQAIAGQSRAFLIETAATVGFEIEIEEHVEFSCESSCEAYLTQGDWRYVYTVHAPELVPLFFRSGQSSVGERLVDEDVSRLECIMDDVRPAHALVLFRYDLPFAGDYAPWSSAGPDAVDLDIDVPAVVAGAI